MFSVEHAIVNRSEYLCDSCFECCLLDTTYPAIDVDYCHYYVLYGPGMDWEHV